jgi:hypothetical protein
VIARPVSHGKGELTVGTAVRFAIEGKTMFVLIGGKEYRATVERVSVAASRVGNGPQSNANAPVARPSGSVPEDAGEALDNDAVVKMIVGGLRADTVIRVIEARPGKYIMAPDSVLALRAAGVPPNVIAAMSAKTSN